MPLMVIDGGPAPRAHTLIDGVPRQASQILGQQRPVSVRSPVSSGIGLPPRPRITGARRRPRAHLAYRLVVPRLQHVGQALALDQVVVCDELDQRLALGHWHIGIAITPVRRRLPEQQQIFGQADAHAGSILALLGPAQSIGARILAHHIGDDRHHAQIGEAMPPIMIDAPRMKWLDGAEAKARHAAWYHAILHMHRQPPPRLQHPQQFRRQIVHLREEMVAVVGMAEIIIARRIFILRPERYAGHDQADAVAFHLRSLNDRVAFPDCPVRPPRAFQRRRAGYRPRQNLACAGKAKAIGPDNLAHARDHRLVPRPLPLQHTPHGAFRFGEYQVDPHLVRLQKALDAMDRLNEIVKLEPDAQEDRPVAMPLEVATRSCQNGLGRQLLHFAIGKGDDAPFSLVQRLRPVNGGDRGDGPLDRLTLALQIMPDYPMGRRVFRPQFHHLGDATVQALALLPRRIHDADRVLLQQQALAALVLAGGAMIRMDLMPTHIQLGQHIALIGKGKVARPLDERGPAIDP
eukprot:Opistho-1_new@83622